MGGETALRNLADTRTHLLTTNECLRVMRVGYREPPPSAWNAFIALNNKRRRSMRAEISLSVRVCENCGCRVWNSHVPPRIGRVMSRERELGKLSACNLLSSTVLQRVSAALTLGVGNFMDLRYSYASALDVKLIWWISSVDTRFIFILRI